MTCHISSLEDARAPALARHPAGSPKGDTGRPLPVLWGQPTSTPFSNSIIPEDNKEVLIDPSWT